MTQHPVAAPPREISDEEFQKRAVRAFQLEVDIKAGLSKGREAMWETAKALHEFDEDAGWSALGHERLQDWLAEPDVQLTHRTYNRLCAAYRETVVRRGIPMRTVQQIDHTKVDIVIGKVNTGEVKIEDALEDARSMGARDLREQYLGKPKAPRANVGDKKAKADLSVDELNKISKGEPGQNGEAALSGQVVDADFTAEDRYLVPLFREMVELMWELYNTYAAPEKKKIRAEHREAMDSLLARVEKAGAVD
jgi:hypothetical protein